jgi:hypothetical protein
MDWAVLNVLYGLAEVQHFGRHGVYLVWGLFPVVRQNFGKPRDQEWQYSTTVCLLNMVISQLAFKCG